MTLTAISPIDGRYAAKCDELRRFCSEYGLIAYRVKVEVEWFLALAANPDIAELPELSSKNQKAVAAISEQFDESGAEAVKQFERLTNHDVKAVEYYVKQQLCQISGLSQYQEFVHFGCTSADINNLAYGLMLIDTRAIALLPQLDALITQLSKLAKENAAVAMLARTHGQAATPTTLGKVFANTVYRLKRQRQQLADLPLLGKFNGAVGNYNAHQVTYPALDWPAVCQRFVESLGLNFNPYTAQIEPHDTIAEFSHVIMRINTILLDFSRDVWSYISLNYFSQPPVEGEVGSSTMPHKINPIDFENAEGNLGVANALLDHLAQKLPISRWQRDLSDSTVLRNLGTAFGHCLISYQSLSKGLDKLVVNQEVIQADLANHWELLAEPIQTVMRRYGIANPYEQLKTLTRGQNLTEQTVRQFIEQLDIPAEAKQSLLSLTPETYIGYAQKLASSD